MAIDADRNAGSMGEDEAKKRRSEVTRKPIFTAQWTGASTFSRRCIAGILTTVINIVVGRWSACCNMA
ncbi:FHIPEP family type III secretion protein [Shigella flexneri]